jgi:hypothetical protein
MTMRKWDDYGEYGVTMRSARHDYARERGLQQSHPGFSPGSKLMGNAFLLCRNSLDPASSAG